MSLPNFENMHYMIQDQSNKKLALERKGHPHWMNDSIQFNKYGDGSVIANIQYYSVDTGKESNLSVLISLEDLRLAYEYLSGMVLSVGQVDKIMKKDSSPEKS